MALRISFSLILLFSILFLPFYISAILVLIGMAYFSFFIEAGLLFLLSDLLYAVKEIKFFNITFVSFLSSIIFLLVIEFLKKKLRFYPKEIK